MLKKKYIFTTFFIFSFFFISFFPLINKHFLTGLIYLKISKNVIDKNDINQTLENLHNFIIFNVDKNLDSKFYPVFDKYTYNSLIDGFTDCSGSAAIYLWILMFLNFDSELLPLYDKDYNISPHTVLSVKNSNKNLIIDPLHNFTFFNKKLDYASLDDICNRQNINTNQLNLLENFNYQYFDNFCFTKKSTMRSNYKIPYFIFKLVNYLPNFYIDYVLKNTINIKYYNNDYFKGRFYYIIGDYEKALKIFSEIKSKQIKYYDFLIGIDEKVNDYEIKNLKKVSVQDLSSYYEKLINIKIHNKFYDGNFENNEHLYQRYVNFLKYYNLKNKINNLT